AVGILYGSSINALLYGYFFQAEDGIRDRNVTGVQTCALPSSLLLGTLFGTFISFTYITWNQHVITLLFWGGIHGIFNGMLAAALIEILQVFPLLAKRVGLENYLFILLTAIVFGKIIGSLYQWLFLMKGS